METYRDKKTWKKDPKPHGRKADVGQNFPVNMHKKVYVQSFNIVQCANEFDVYVSNIY